VAAADFAALRESLASNGAAATVLLPSPGFAGEGMGVRAAKSLGINEQATFAVGSRPLPSAPSPGRMGP